MTKSSRSAPVVFTVTDNLPPAASLTIDGRDFVRFFRPELESRLLVPQRSSATSAAQAPASISST